MTGWPQSRGTGAGETPLHLADLTGDGDLEIIVPTVNFGIRVFEHDGTLVPGWGTGLSACPSLYVVVGNLVGDAQLEVVSWCGVTNEVRAFDASGNSLPGWPVQTTIGISQMHSFWALGDLDADGYDELVYLSAPGLLQVHTLDGDGTALTGWPVTLPFPPTTPYDTLALSGLAVGDMEFDGRDEVVVTYVGGYQGNAIDSPAWLLNGDGTLRPGWPTSPFPGGDLWTPVIVDLDGDYAPEVLFPSSHRLRALRPDTSFAFSSLAASSIHRFCAVGDLENDGALEVVLPGRELRIVKYSTSGQPAPLYVHAATSDIDQYERYYGPSLGDVTGDGNLEILVWTQLDTSISASNNYTIHVLDSNLQPVSGWPMLHTPSTMPRETMTTALGDLDGDGDAEVIYGYQDNVYVWNHPAAGSIGQGVAWGQFGHDGSSGSFFHRGNVPTAKFLRGDANLSGSADVADVVFVLRYLFLGEPSTCLPALDVNADQVVSPPDAIALLNILFTGMFSPLAPYPSCIEFPTDFTMPCFEFACP